MRRDAIINLDLLDVNSYGVLDAHEHIYIQDYVHIGTKLRNKLLKPSVSLPFGNKAISVSHLKILLDTCPKDYHGLTLSDVSPYDRQNFKSLQKMMEKRVTDCLEAYVVDSEATVIFIDICKNVTSAGLDKTLTPLQRVYRIWNATFLLRIWRKFILESDYYNTDDNFITPNAHACIELNATNPVQLIIHLRRIGR